MSPRFVYILVPGIRTATGDNSAWCVRMADDIMRARPEAKATEFRYYAGPLTRRIKQARHARQLASVIEQWARAGFKAVVVGHSNGCDLIERAMRLVTVPVYALHLIAAASDNDFCRNGYVEKLLSESIHEVHVYYSASDAVLSRAARASRLFGFLGLGYGSLGELGPVNVPASIIGTAVRLHKRAYMGHSDWFSGAHYADTMDAITYLDRAA